MAEANNGEPDIRERLEHAIKRVGDLKVEVRVWSIVLAAVVLAAAILL